jgi:hypothetical protein
MQEDIKKDEFIKGLAYLAGAFSKFVFESYGNKVDYKINGESLENILKLPLASIDEKIKLAILEERYEDAAALKKLKDSTK